MYIYLNSSLLKFRKIVRNKHIINRNNVNIIHYVIILKPNCEIKIKTPRLDFQQQTVWKTQSFRFTAGQKKTKKWR